MPKLLRKLTVDAAQPPMNRPMMMVVIFFPSAVGMRNITYKMEEAAYMGSAIRQRAKAGRRNESADSHRP